MKIAVLGGAGAMARVTLCDLKESREVDKILVADLHLAAAERAAQAQQDPRFEAASVDVRDVEATTTLLRGWDVVINATQYYFNLEVMRAALQARVHYLDLGGLFHMTRRQVLLHDEFVQADLLAILGMGSTPGLTNVMARYACDRLSTVDAIDIKIGAVDLAVDTGEFAAPYSIRTIIDECVIPPYVFEAGKWTEVLPFSGAETVHFPTPVGEAEAHYTIHSEVASFPLSFAGKGIQRATFRIAFPPAFIQSLKLLMKLGLLSDVAVSVGTSSVNPRDLLTAILSRPPLCESIPDDCDCIRVEISGAHAGRSILHTMESLIRPHGRWQVSAGALDTGVPPSVVAQMVGRHDIPERGVLHPEQCIAPMPFFAALAERGIKVESTIRETVV